MSINQRVRESIVISTGLSEIGIKKAIAFISCNFQ